MRLPARALTGVRTCEYPSSPGGTHASSDRGDGLHKALLGCLGLIAAIAAHGTDSASAQTASRPPPFKQLRLDGNFVRWSRPDSSSSLVLTYKVLDEFHEFEGARNCKRMTGVAAITERLKIERTVFDAELRAALAMWEGAADIRFREAEENEVPNINIGAQAEPEGWAFADVFYNRSAPEAVKPITRSLVCLNPAKGWKIGFDGDLRVYDLRYTLAHEIGHAIGLDHPNAPGQIMGYRYEESFRDLQPGDLSGAVALYGPSRGVMMAHTPEPAPDTPPQQSADAEPDGSTSRALVTTGR